jgi:hypothetical protein
MPDNTQDNSTEKLSRAESARVNGARSRGPVSPEGKARSSMNAIKHGLRSSRVVLSTECFDIYSELLQDYIDCWLPQSRFEKDLIENMVNARWRIRRIEGLETAAIDAALSENEEAAKQTFVEVDPTTETALAIRAFVKNEPALEILSRHEERLHKIFERSYKLLERSRSKANLMFPSPEQMSDIEANYPANNQRPDADSGPEAPNQAIKPNSPEPPPQPPGPPGPPEPPVQPATQIEVLEGQIGRAFVDSIMRNLGYAVIILLLLIARPEANPRSLPAATAIIQPAKRPSTKSLTSRQALPASTFKAHDRRNR